MPDLPGNSSAEPTLYQSMWVTTGVRRSGTTTTSRPFASVKCATAGAADAGRASGTASAAQAARTAKVRIRSMGTMALSSAVPITNDR